jgi:hypothetical protein
MGFLGPRPEYANLTMPKSGPIGKMPYERSTAPGTGVRRSLGATGPRESDHDGVRWYRLKLKKGGI